MMKAGEIMRDEMTALQMMDHLPNMIWRDDLNRQRVYLNKTWLDFTGMHREEALGNGWMNALHPEDVLSFTEIYTQSFENQKPFETVHRLRRFDGEYRKVMNSANPYYDQSGNFAGFVGSLYDITKHKDFEIALKNINNFYMKVFENFPVTIWGADHTGRFTFVSQNGVEFLGESQENIMNGEWQRFLHPEDRIKYNEQYKASMSTGATVEIELRFRNQAGEYHWFQISNKPMYNEEGSLVGYIGMGINIHDRKLAEDKLKIYKLLLENAQDIILFTDIHGQIIEANEKAVEVYGYSKEALIGLNMKSIRRDWALSQDQIMQANKLGIFLEAVHHRKDGTSFAVEITTQGAKIAGKDVLMSIIRDITERKAGEKALRSSEEKFKKLFDNIADIALLREFTPGKALGGRFIEVNQMACEKLGYNREAFSDLSLIDLVPKEEKYKLLDIKEKLLSEGKSYDEVVYIMKNGEKLPLEVNAVTFEINDRQVVLSICRDISERKRMDAMVMNSERRYRSLVMNMNSGFAYHKVIYNENRDIIDLEFVVVNHSFEEMFNVKNEKIKGKTYREVFPHDYDIFLKYRQDYERVIKYGKNLYYEEIYSEAFDKWFSLSAYSPETDYYAIVIRDVDHKKKSDMELRRAKEEAENANRIKSEFLANMSHEIRTPINGILGMIDLTMLTLLDDDQRENLVTAKNCAASLLQVINDILDFSKIEAGKLILHNIDFDLEKLMFQITKSHYISASEKGLKLTYSLSSNIPRFLIGDPNRLQQILNNLINNAIKFTDYGEIKINIKGNVDSGGTVGIEFSVADTGIGISQENIQRLFKSFSQIDGSYTRQFGGTGLGLVISKQLAEMMGGRLWVESKEGRGSTFYFTVTLAAGSRPEGRTTLLPNRNRSFKRYQILVVEDDAINQLFLSRMLKEEGHFVESASNGWQALAFCENKQYDVILMDIQMPEMDGIEASKRIRQIENNASTPIIALTAYALQGDREKFLENGMDEYVSKPVNMEELLQAMDKVITGNEHRIEIHKSPFVIKNGELIFDADKEKISEEERLAYKDKINKNLKNLIEAIESSNTASVEGIAHEIKELCYQLGAIELKNSAFKIELAARRGSVDEILEGALKLAQDFEIYKIY